VGSPITQIVLTLRCSTGCNVCAIPGFARCRWSGRIIMNDIIFQLVRHPRLAAHPAKSCSQKVKCRWPGFGVPDSVSNIALKSAQSTSPPSVNISSSKASDLCGAYRLSCYLQRGTARRWFVLTGPEPTTRAKPKIPNILQNVFGIVASLLPCGV